MPSDNYVLLPTGQKMPLVGLGTWKSEAGQVSSEFRVVANLLWVCGNSGNIGLWFTS